jgi:hypothetical protein
MRGCSCPLPPASIVSIQVAAGIPAIGWGDAQGIVAVDMAQIAGHGRVAVGKREACRGVVEYSCGPGGDWVAGRALRGRRGESGRHVIGN